MRARKGGTAVRVLVVTASARDQAYVVELLAVGTAKGLAVVTVSVTAASDSHRLDYLRLWISLGLA